LPPVRQANRESEGPTLPVSSSVVRHEALLAPPTRQNKQRTQRAPRRAGDKVDRVSKRRDGNMVGYGNHRTRPQTRRSRRAGDAVDRVS
jgi:hypothetical protein